jgi:hypothetical protein
VRRNGRHGKPGGPSLPELHGLLTTGAGTRPFPDDPDSPITVSTHRQPELPHLSRFTRKPSTPFFFRNGCILRLLRNRTGLPDWKSQMKVKKLVVSGE